MQDKLLQFSTFCGSKHEFDIPEGYYIVEIVKMDIDTIIVHFRKIEEKQNEQNSLPTG